jgi:polyhydroxyalkanoate synthesis regulator phasin
MFSADLLISEIITRNCPSRKNTSEVSFGTSSASSRESGEKMPTKYERLYDLQTQLNTAKYKLKKAQERVKKLEQQIAEVSDNRWDVT